MKTIRNVTDHTVDLPAYGIRVASNDTVEVPDDVAVTLEGNPMFKPSRSQHPDVTVDEAAAAAVTGSIPIQAPAPAPTAPPVDPDDD